jgi:hypothetical protein
MNLSKQEACPAYIGDTMRIEIDHKTTQKGMLLKKAYYEVILTVHFSHEEQQIIRQRGLLKTKLMDRRPADARVDDRDENFELRVEHLMSGKADHFLCATPSQSKIYEEQLLDALSQMKLWLGDNAETGSRRIVEL